MSVGAVYDRAYFVDCTKRRAVIDRAYNGSARRNRPASGFLQCFHGLLLVAHDVVVRELPPDRGRGVVVDEARRGGLDTRFLDRPPIHEDSLDHQPHSGAMSVPRMD